MRAPGRLLAAAVLAAALTACSIGPTPTPLACPGAAPAAGEVDEIVRGADQAVVVTNKGEFAIDLLPEAAPIATANFVALARCGFYDGISFHRVIPGFVAQAGDPQTRRDRGDFAGLGTGGPGYRFVIEPPAEGIGYDAYSVSMANAAQPETNGSQFFIALVDLNARLSRDYTIFGTVETGREVVDAIGQVPTNENDVPLDPVVIETIRIEGEADGES